nr:MAG TPA: hypothetical protein [Caudoviricetes sp.]
MYIIIYKHKHYYLILFANHFFLKYNVKYYIVILYC